MTLTPKENYIKMLHGEIPDFIPSMLYETHSAIISDEMLTPQSAPNGPVTTAFGIEYVGSKDINNGAMPAPGKTLLSDIRDWRDVIKIPDTRHRDWEGYYKKQTEAINRTQKAVSCGGSDYFLTLVSFMGFEQALMAMYEEPEEVYALLDYVSEHYLNVMRQQLKYVKPELYTIMDDDAAYRSPFFSVDMYRQLVKPFHKRHADLALENGLLIERHDCGHCECFIDDWLELGVRSWNPAQVSNDLVAIKKKYAGKLALCGCWDNQGKFSSPLVAEEILREALYTYVNTFAPGGGFSFTANFIASADDPIASAKREIIRDFYYSYAKNYYKTH